jgi:uncharacterized protein YeaO (DUF488 family)
MKKEMLRMTSWLKEVVPSETPRRAYALLTRLRDSSVR